MSRKERAQLVVFTKLSNGEITQAEGAAKLRMSERWIRKKLKRYRSDGDNGLIHRGRGRRSKRQWDGKERERMLALLRGEWHGFGPTLIAEKLKELHGIVVSRETIRKALIAEQLWQPGKRKMKHRAWRERKERVGMMTQLDGSPHDWFEGRGPWCTLLVFIDDATSRLMWLEFAPSESLHAVMTAQLQYLREYGAPQRIYVDRGGTFKVNTNNPDHEKLTQFERALGEINVELIHARSPQAKGRVERANKTLQDRLVKEMRLAGVSSIDAANRFIQESGYIKRHNDQFAVQPAQEGDMHSTVADYDLDNIFCIKDSRVLTNDFTISYKRHKLQLLRYQKAVVRPRETIDVYEWLDGSIRLFVHCYELEFKQVALRQKKPSIIDYVNQERMTAQALSAC